LIDPPGPTTQEASVTFFHLPPWVACQERTASSLELLGKLTLPQYTIAVIANNALHYSGIGLETSILFLQEGANVLLADINGDALASALSKVKGVVGQVPGRAETFLCDVSKEDQVEAMVKHVDAWGGLDVIFNNAGIMHANVRT